MRRNSTTIYGSFAKNNFLAFSRISRKSLLERRLSNRSEWEENLSFTGLHKNNLHPVAEELFLTRNFTAFYREFGPKLANYKICFGQLQETFKPNKKTDRGIEFADSGFNCAAYSQGRQNGGTKPRLLPRTPFSLGSDNECKLNYEVLYV